MSPIRTAPQWVVEQDSAEFVHLLELNFASGAIRLCTAAQDIFWNFQTWEAIGGLLEMGGIEETTDGKGQGVDLKLSGVDQTVLSVLLSSQYRGRAVKLWRAHLDSTTGLLGGEPLLLFQGLQLSPYTIEETREFGGGTVTVSTRVSGYFGVERVRGIQSNLMSHQHHFAGDTFFKNTALLANVKIHWGTQAPLHVGNRSGRGGRRVYFE